jgi:hypothetical protein
MNTNVIVTIGDKDYEYPANTTLLEISRDFQKDYENQIILAFVNNKFESSLKKSIIIVP